MSTKNTKEHHDNGRMYVSRKPKHPILWAKAKGCSVLIAVLLLAWLSQFLGGIGGTAMAILLAYPAITKINHLFDMRELSEEEKRRVLNGDSSPLA